VLAQVRAVPPPILTVRLFAASPHVAFDP